MKSKLYVKILALSVIFIFIGVSFSSGFAIEDDKSTEIVTIDSENPKPIFGDILENSNCYVIGYATNITRFNSGSNYNIGFGAHSGWNDDYESRGFIQTSGSEDKWGYIGRFIGKNGIQTFVDPFDHDVKWDVYIGIKGFRGLVYVGLYGWFWGNTPSTGIFIGRADNVKIMTID